MIGIDRLRELVNEAQQRRIEIETVLFELEESARELRAKKAQEAADATD